MQDVLGGVLLNPPETPCLCGSIDFEVAFTYEEPPQVETRYDDLPLTDYHREIHRCRRCAHLVSVHDLDMGPEFYMGGYVNAKYGSREGVAERFEHVMGLPPNESDNEGRVRRIVDHTTALGLGSGRTPTVLDVGSGLCVFLARIRSEGWDGVAVDPDPRAATHAAEHVGVRAIQADFMEADDLGRFDLVTFNKVLEHAANPVKMLAKARGHLQEGGRIYVEVPDGERAARTGPHREEFVLEHLHTFSPASLDIAVRRADLELERLERVRDPSGKFTLFAFMREPGEDAA